MSALEEIGGSRLPSTADLVRRAKALAGTGVALAAGEPTQEPEPKREPVDWAELRRSVLTAVHRSHCGEALESALADSWTDAYVLDDPTESLANQCDWALVDVAWMAAAWLRDDFSPEALLATWGIEGPAELLDWMPMYDLQRLVAVTVFTFDHEGLSELAARCAAFLIGCLRAARITDVDLHHDLVTHLLSRIEVWSQDPALLGVWSDSVPAHLLNVPEAPDRVEVLIRAAGYLEGLYASVLS